MTGLYTTMQTSVIICRLVHAVAKTEVVSSRFINRLTNLYTVYMMAAGFKQCLEYNTQQTS